MQFLSFQSSPERFYISSIKDQLRKNIQYGKNSGPKWVDLCMEINLGLIQLSLLHTRVRHQGVITATHLTKPQPKYIFFVVFVVFLFQFISLLPHLIFFTTGGQKSLAAHLCMPFSFTHSWLSNRLVSQRREGDSDLLSAQPQNNKITSLPACSGHGKSINLVSLIIFLLNVAGRREWSPPTES